MTLITAYRNLSVKYKLQLIIMATVSVALLASCGAILTYAYFELPDDSRHDLTTLAVVYGANATAALTFGDHHAAGELLASLSTQRQIVSAVMYSADAVAVAHYRRSDAVNSIIPQIRADGTWFEADRLKVFQQILLDKQPIGAIFLEADLADTDRRLRHSGAVLLATLFCTSGLAFLLASRPRNSSRRESPMVVGRSLLCVRTLGCGELQDHAASASQNLANKGGRGKTTVALNLAVCFAKAGCRTLA